MVKDIIVLFGRFLSDDIGGIICDVWKNNFFVIVGFWIFLYFFVLVKDIVF